MPEILVFFKQMLLVCSLAGFFRAPVAGAEESIATILHWKFQGVKNMMDHDWLTELVNMKKRDGGLQFGILEARFMTARLRGHPDSVLMGSTGDGLRNALISETSADALGLILQEALGTSGGGWSSVPKGVVENVWACLKEVDSLETDHDGRVRARPGRRGELLRVAAALGVLRGYLLPWKRLPVVFEALRVSEDLSVWYSRAPLELTVWFVADGLFWAMTLASPAVSYAIGWLDWLAKGQSESFRGMLVALLALVILYFTMSLLIEAVFITAGILYRGSRILFRRMFGKQKIS